MGQRLGAHRLDIGEAKWLEEGWSMDIRGEIKVFISELNCSSIVICASCDSRTSLSATQEDHSCDLSVGFDM